MKRTAFLLIAVSVLLAQNVLSQRLYFCEEYRGGEEIGVSDDLYAEP
jgi:hypothetical protein